MKLLALLLLISIPLALWIWFRRSRGTSLPAKSPTAQRRGSLAAPAAQPVQSPTSNPSPPPEELVHFQWQSARQLSPEAASAWSARLLRLPRPSPTLQQLVSPAFIATASSEDLTKLVKSEPLVAARLLARVNTPAYGLQAPLVQLGQAITFLGLQTVRSMCIEYLLEASFKARNSAQQARLDALWRAASLGSEIALRLAQGLNLPNPSGIATRVVLSFVGHLAVGLLTPEQDQDDNLLSLFDRSRQEQEQLGLPAAEIGYLLMQTWELPAPLVEAASAVDRLLVTPFSAGDPEAGSQAIAYLAARWGEQLALGAESEPALSAPDRFHLDAYLASPGIARWRELTGSASWIGQMQKLLDRA